MLYVKGLAMIRTLIRIVNRTVMCSFVLDPYFFMLKSWKNRIYKIRVHSYCVRMVRTTLSQWSCNVCIVHETFVLSPHALSCSFTYSIRTYSCWLHTCLTIFLLLTWKNRAQIINFSFVLSQAGISATIKIFAFTLIRAHIRHSVTEALGYINKVGK